MKSAYDFSRRHRRQAAAAQDKSCITIRIDTEVLAALKAESARTGTGYETLINEVLARHVGTAGKPMTAEQVRQIVREELAHQTQRD
jgi:uncharacterized protein (DUF4415 family)